MRSALLLLAFVAAASANFGWQVGREFHYQYETKTVAGIPALKNQLSGLGLRARVIVQAKGAEELLLKLADISFARVQNEIFAQGWRQEIDMSFSPLESQLAEVLSTPFKVMLQQGKVVRIAVSAEEPLWSQNLKRALASQVSMSMAKATVQQHLSQNAIYKQQETFFTVEEEPSVAGECKTYYTVTPVPENVARAHERDLPEEIKEKVEELPAYMITKTKNYNECSRKAAFVHTSTVDELAVDSDASQAEHKRFSSRSSVSRFLIRGQPKHNFVVLRVWSEGEYVVKPFATKTENVLVASNQTLVLRKLEPIRNQIQEPSDLKLETLVYQAVKQQSGFQSQQQDQEQQLNRFAEPEYLLPEQELQYLRQEQQEHQRFKQGNQYPTLTGRPAMFRQKNVPTQRIQEQIKELVEKVQHEIQSISELGKNQPSLKVDMISRALVPLNLEEMEQVYRQIVPQPKPTNAEQKLRKQILIDALAMAGTNPAFMLLKQKIEKREIKGEVASQVIMTLPVTIKTPTPEILKELVQLIKSVQEQEQVWTTAILAASNLAYRACVNPMNKKHSFGISSRVFCHRQQAEEILLPYLRQQLYQTQKQSKATALVQAIGNVGSPQSFEILRPIILGEQNVQSKQVRARAIYALNRLTSIAPKHMRDQIRSLLVPVFKNQEEQPEVRVAAFLAILSSKPQEPFYTETATGTWFEQSQHVGQFVFSTLENLANSTYPSHHSMSRLASVALPLAKPFRLGAQYSQNLLFTHNIPSRNIASFLQWGQISGKYSLIPEVFYVKSKSYMGGFDMPNFEGAIQSQGIQTLLNKIWGPLNREQIDAGLPIERRKDQEAEGNLWFRSLGQMERIITADTIRSLAVEGMIDMERENEFRVNFQKTLPISDNQVAFPSESGFEVYAIQKTPAMVSVQGKIQFQTEGKLNMLEGRFPSDLKIKTDLKPILCVTRIVEAGIISPFTNEIFAAGHNTHGLVNLPGKLEIKLNKAQQEIEIVSERASQVPTEVELFEFRAVPYTTQAKRWDYIQFNARAIKTQQQPAEYRQKYGKQMVGLSFEALQEIDQPFNDMAGFYHLLQPHNALSAAQFMTTPHTLRGFTYKLKLNLPESETKQARLTVKYQKEQRQFNINSFETEEALEEQYYQHKSQEFRHIKQEAQEYFASPLSKMPECEEAQSPCRELLERLAFTRNPASRRNLENMESEEVKEAYVHSVHAEITLAGPEPRRFRSSAVLAVSPTMRQQKLSVMFEKVQSSRQEQYRVCANGQMKFPELPLNREQLIEAPKTALGHLTVKYGRQCSESKFQARLVMAQTEEQKEAARALPIARECRKHEQEGQKYTPACMAARHQATLLNKVVIDIEAENTPKALRNLTLHLNDLVKYALYPHMSNKQIDVSNPEKKVKIVLDFLPVKADRSWMVLDAAIYKPKENTRFQKLKLARAVEAVLPLSAEVSVLRKTLNTYMNGQYSPMCKVQPKWITTFDNVSYAYPLSNCYHLIAKDCSQQIPIQVFAKQSAEGKVIKIQLGQMEVIMTPQRKVKVQGETVEVQKNQERIFKSEASQKVILRVQKPIEKEIEIEAPIHGLKVRTDGENFSVEMSNMYRGRTCGLCGDMNGEKTAELKDPKGCIRSSPKEFAASYAVGSCQERQAEPTQCIREQNKNSYAQSQPQGRSVERASSGVQYFTKVVSRGPEVCFSTKPVPECSLGHQPTEILNMPVKFHCVARGHAANQLVARARQGILEEMFQKEADFKEFVAAPESCKPIQY